MTRPVADTDGVSLAVEALTRRALLIANSIGMALTGALFTIDAFRGAFDTSRAYRLTHHVPGGPWLWATWPLLSALLVLAGLCWSRWRLAYAGLIGLSVWFLAQTTLIIAYWQTVPKGMLGPVGVYGLVLFPKSLIHAVSVRRNGRRQALL